jgi:DNA relaxase NicK
MVPFQLGDYAGQRCGRVGFGMRENAAIFQLSGDVADQHFARLWTGHDTLTRIDVAVTVRTADYEQAIASNAFAAAVALRADHPRLAEPTLVQSGDGGDTCYIGRRKLSAALSAILTVLNTTSGAGAMSLR